MGIRVRNNVSWATGARRVSGPFSGGPPKALLHATICPSLYLPGYKNQGEAPHETMLWDRVKQRMIPKTHFYFDNYARALGDIPGGVATNKDGVRQWELGGYIGSTTPRGEFDILTAPNTYWEQFADLCGDIILSWGVAHRFSRSFDDTLPTTRRMSPAEWDSYSGFCTHADAAENTHWDSPLGAHVKAILTAKIWPSSTPIPTPHLMGVDMYMFQVKGTAPVYVTTGTHYWWIPNGVDKARIEREWKVLGIPTTVVLTNGVSGHGVLVGPVPK